MARGMCGRGDVHGKEGGCPFRLACLARKACMAGGGVHGRRDGHCSGRYASYWNAFLLHCYCCALDVSEQTG